MKDLSKNKKIILGVCAAVVLLAIIAAAVLIGGGGKDKESADADGAESAAEYEIVFNANGGSFVAGLTVKAGEKLAEPEAPTREGYTFDGWTTEDGEKFDFSAAVDKDIVLKAAWKKDESADEESGSAAEAGSDADSSSGANTSSGSSASSGSKKAESTIDKINLNDYPSTTINYCNYTQPIEYYFITNLGEVFPSLAGKSVITLGWEDEDPAANGTDVRINEWYAAFDKLKFDSSREKKAKSVLQGVKNKKYKGVLFETNVGSSYGGVSESHGVSYKYEYVTISKEPLTTLYNGIENTRKAMDKEISGALSGSIKVILPGYGVYGSYEGGLLNEEMCKKYNFTYGRW